MKPIRSNELEHYKEEINKKFRYKAQAIESEIQQEAQTLSDKKKPSFQKLVKVDKDTGKEPEKDDSGKLGPDDFDTEKTNYLGVGKDDSEVEKEEPKLKKLSDKTKQTQTEMVNQLDTIIENETAV